jgi:hypothetical protein
VRASGMVQAGYSQQRTEELLQRVAVLLEQLTLRRDSADDRAARVVLPGSRGNPTAVALGRHP